jgi:hypothetical protein
MCTRARPYGRAGRCGFGGQGVTLSSLVLTMTSETINFAGLNYLKPINNNSTKCQQMCGYAVIMQKKCFSQVNGSFQVPTVQLSTH